MSMMSVEVEMIVWTRRYQQK